MCWRMIWMARSEEVSGETVMGSRFMISLAAILVASSAAGFASLAYLAWRRRGPNRAPCLTCPERTLPVCRGFAEIVAAERSFRAAAAAAMDRLRLTP